MSPKMVDRQRETSATPAEQSLHDPAPRRRGRARDTPAVVAIFAMVLLWVCGLFTVAGVFLVWVLFAIGPSLFVFATIAVPLPVGMAAFDLIKLRPRAHNTTMVACGVLLAWVAMNVWYVSGADSAWVHFELEWVLAVLAAIAVVAPVLPKTIYRDYFANLGIRKRVENEF